MSFFGDKKQDKNAQAINDEMTSLSKSVPIYSMPKNIKGSLSQTTINRTNQQNKKNKPQAKKTGILIMIIGGAFLVAAVVGAYFYLIKKPSPIVAPEIVNKEPEIINEIAPDNKGDVKDDNTENIPMNDKINDVDNSLIDPDFFEIIDGGQPTAGGLVYSSDADRDGLLDKEEVIFGTNINNQDSDNDGYGDLLEIINFYNPADVGSIIDNFGIKKYSNNNFSYSVFYPSAWPVENVGGDNSIIFKTQNDQFVQIIAATNERKSSISEWVAQEAGSNIASLTRVSGQGWEGLKSKDGLTVYIADNKFNFIFVFTYNLGISNSLDYKNIFDMMVKSFVIED